MCVFWSCFICLLILGLFASALYSPQTRDFTASPEAPETKIHFWRRPKRNPSPFRPLSATAKLQTPTHAPLLLLLLFLFLYALRRSTLSASVEQEHRTESQLSAYTHARTASCGIPHGASVFPSAYQVRLLPGDGRCSSRVSASSERRSRVLLIGDAAGSLPLFLFPAQESSCIDASSRDLKTFDQDITCTALVIFFLGGGTERSWGFLWTCPPIRSVDAAVKWISSEITGKQRGSSLPWSQHPRASEGAAVPRQSGSGREVVIALARWRRCAAPVLAAPCPVCALGRNRDVWIIHVVEVQTCNGRHLIETWNRVVIGFPLFCRSTSPLPFIYSEPKWSACPEHARRVWRLQTERSDGVPAPDLRSTGHKPTA